MFKNFIFNINIYTYFFAYNFNLITKIAFKKMLKIKYTLKKNKPV